MTEVIIRGASGAEYKFWAHPCGTQFVAAKGIYAMAHSTAHGWWVHYVGQAKNLNDRAGTGVWDHEKISAATAAGATHVLASVFDVDDATLSWIENDIIRALDPKLNKNAPPGFGLRGA